jgi:hypothetical protein
MVPCLPAGRLYLCSLLLYVFKNKNIHLFNTSKLNYNNEKMRLGSFISRKHGNFV